MSHIFKIMFMTVFALALIGCSKDDEDTKKLQEQIKELQEQIKAASGDPAKVAELQEQIEAAAGDPAKVAELQEQIKAAGGDPAKIAELQQKLAELQEFLSLSEKYTEEYTLAVKECDQLTQDPNADPAKVAAAKKKLEDITDKILNDTKTGITGKALSLNALNKNCSYAEWQEDNKQNYYIDIPADEDPLAQQPEETDEIEDWGTAW